MAIRNLNGFLHGAEEPQGEFKAARGLIVVQLFVKIFGRIGANDMLRDHFFAELRLFLSTRSTNRFFTPSKNSDVMLISGRGSSSDSSRIISSRLSTPRSYDSLRSL